MAVMVFLLLYWMEVNLQIGLDTILGLIMEENCQFSIPDVTSVVPRAQNWNHFDMINDHIFPVLTPD